MSPEHAVRRVTFVGLGNMGDPIAANLVSAGFDVVGVDAVPGRAAQWAARTGGSHAAAAADAARGADAVVTILPTSEHVAAVVADVVPVLDAGAVLVDMTSGVPAVTRRLAGDLAARGVALVDVAVSGGVSRAADATIALMAGGDDEALDRVQPLLEAVGRATFRCGGVGTGQAMKSLNNLVSAGGLLVAVEALLVGATAGLDPATMVDVLNESTGMNNATKVKLKQFVLSRRYSSGFGLDLMVKDLGIALGLADAGELDVPLSQALVSLWRDASERLGPGRDHTEIARYSEQVAGVELAAPAT